MHRLMQAEAAQRLHVCCLSKALFYSMSRMWPPQCDQTISGIVPSSSTPARWCR